MATKIEVTVDAVLTSAVHLEVEPGDKLIVMNGVVIGMVEKRSIQQQPKRRPNALPSNIEIIENHIIDMLKKRKMTAREMLSRLRIRIKDDKFVIGPMVKSLRDRNIIKPIDDKRFPTYNLVDKETIVREYTKDVIKNIERET